MPRQNLSVGLHKYKKPLLLYQRIGGKLPFSDIGNRTVKSPQRKIYDAIGSDRSWEQERARVSTLSATRPFGNDHKIATTTMIASRFLLLLLTGPIWLSDVVVQAWMYSSLKRGYITARTIPASSLSSSSSLQSSPASSSSEASTAASQSSSVVVAPLPVAEEIPYDYDVPQDAVVHIKPLAMRRLRELRTQQQQPTSPTNIDAEFLTLRMGVRSGGCSGMSYVMDFADTTKQPIADDDQVDTYESDKIRCIVDAKSMLYLYGLELDYSPELIGGGFRFFNPNAEESCGCGSSFGV